MILIVGPTPSYQRVLTFSKVIPDQVNRAAIVETLASGKAVNAARAVVRSGGRAECLLFLGGETGDWMKRVLKDEKIPVHAVPVTASTRICTTVIETETGNVTELVENAGPVSEQDVAAFCRMFEQGLSRATAVVCTGTLPPGAPATLYRDFARTAAQRGLPVVIDAQGGALMAALDARPLLIKPNRSELAEAMACDCSAEASLHRAMRQAREKGAEWVLVTDGAQPAWLAGPEGIYQITPPSVEEGNPIGSGDALGGGVALALSEGKGVLDAVKQGVVWGAANVAGGYGRLDKMQIASLMSQIRVQKLQ